MTTNISLWAALAAALPPDTIAWRQDGRPTERGGKFYARFVAYVEAGTVRQRLDSVVPGEWDLTLEPLPSIADIDPDEAFAFKARLQVMSVIREDVGVGKDYKQASTDSFKRAAVRFGIGHELYEMEPLWVEVDGDGKFAKPIEDPAKVYARKYGQPATREQAARAIGQAELPLPDKGRSPVGRPELAGNATARDLLAAMRTDPDMTPDELKYVNSKLEDGDLTEDDLAKLAAKVQLRLSERKAQRVADSMARQKPGGNPQPRENKRAPAASGASNDGASAPLCPECDGAMWDNRAGKRNPKAPDFKCKDRKCEGVIWPPKPNAKSASSKPGKETDGDPVRRAPDQEFEEFPGALLDEDDDLPF